MLTPALKRVAKQGWAYKRAGSRLAMAGWKLKWLVLLDMPVVQLLIFDQRDHAAQDLPPKHVVYPVVVEHHDPPDGGGGGRSKCGKKRGDQTKIFSVISKDRKYVFAAQSKKERDEWIDLLVQSTNNGNSNNIDPPPSGPSALAVRIHPPKSAPGAAPVSPLGPHQHHHHHQQLQPQQRHHPADLRTSHWPYLNVSMDASALSFVSYDTTEDYNSPSRVTDVEALSIGASVVLSAEELHGLGRAPNSSDSEYSRRKENKLGSSLDRSPLKAGDPWNARYQKLMGRRPRSDEAAVQRDVKLCEVIGSFGEIAQIQGQKIIDNYHSLTTTTAAAATTSENREQGDPPGMQNIAPGTVVVGEVLFHLAANYDVAENQDLIEAAEKKAGHELKAIRAFNTCDTDLHTPLSCILDYKGFRLVAYAVMPFDEDKTLCLDLQGPEQKVDDAVLQKLDKVGRQLNLKEHAVDLPGGRRVTVPVSGRLCAHRCHDAAGSKNNPTSYYVVKLAGTFPLDVSRKLTDRSPPPNPQKRLRPEFVKEYHTPLSSDAFNLAKPRREQEAIDTPILNACKSLHDRWIPAFVQKLDNLEILPVDSASLTQEMHRHGINMRYTGTVASTTKLPYIRELCIVEMVSRSCKKVFRTRLRRAVFHFRSVEATKVEDEMRAYVINQFNQVLGESECARKFWEEKLAQVVYEKFKFELDFLTFSSIHRPALFLSMQHHCCVSFQDTIDYDFTSPAPIQRKHFVSFVMRVKQLEGRHQNLIGKLPEEEIHVYELARHVASRGPRAKLGRNEMTAMRFNALARRFNAAGRHEDARLYGHAALNVASRNHAGTALILMNALETDFMLSNGALDEGEMVGRYNAALGVLRFHWGENHPLMITIHDKLAQLYCKGGQNEQGYNYHTYSMTTAFRILGKNHPVSAMHLTKAGYILLATRRNDAAVQKFQEALDVFSALDPESEHVAENHYCIAEALFDKEDIDGATWHSQRAKRIRELVHGNLHPKTVESYQQLAKTTLASYRHYEGVITPHIKQCYHTAISCYEKIFKYLKSPLAAAPAVEGGGANRSAREPPPPPPPAAGGMVTAQAPCPAPPSAPPSKDLALLDLTRTLISLKLRLIPSHLRELLRALRAQENIQYPEELVKDVILRLVHLTPCVLMDNIFQRVEDKEASSVAELAICIQIAEKSDLTLVV